MAETTPIPPLSDRPAGAGNPGALDDVVLVTDGACIGNPGPGGWAWLLRHPATGRSRHGSGGEHHTTNNRMEIMGVIQGLSALRRPCRVTVLSDSQYLVRAISGWIARWKRFGWKRSRHAATLVRNVDLWRRLDEVMATHVVSAQWVRGHAGHDDNETCDALAQAAAQAVARTPAPPPPPPLDLRVDAGAGLFAVAPGEDQDDAPDPEAEAAEG